MSNSLRSLPSVDRLLRHPSLAGLQERVRAAALTEHARRILARHRDELGAGNGHAPPSLDALAAELVDVVEGALRPPLRPVINATGVVIHTNLGRAPLSAATRDAMQAAATGYSNLEFDLAEGKRGSRLSHLDALLRDVIGAEAGLLVNNNASALLMALSVFAQDREVIVSRGQAVEIGGGFRIPDVLRASGARLVEVGTTNRTRAADYANAVTAGTAALLRVHASNFKIVGFTEQASLHELREAAQRAGVLLFDDLGSGCLLDTARYGMAPEPRPQDSLAAGVDLVMFSGDKLLGGPQAGIIVGRANLVERLRAHPLARALRADKTAIAGLAATLQHYLRDEAEREIPVWRMIAMEDNALRTRATAWRDALDTGEVRPDRSMIGGGSLPEEGRPTFVLALRPARGSVDAMAKRLRLADRPVVGRIAGDTLLLDPRTVDAAEEPALLDTMRAALAGG